MKDNPRILIWINCYGAWAPDLRQPIETIGYDQYLSGVTSAVVSLKDQVDTIYVSGGLLDKNGRSECATTIPELQRRLSTVGVSRVTIQADESSITSISIARKFLEVWHSEYPETIPMLFCDQVRYETNLFILDHLKKVNQYVLPPLREILIPIPRLDNHQNSTPEKQAEKLNHMRQLGVDEVERLQILERRSN